MGLSLCLGGCGGDGGSSDGAAGGDAAGAGDPAAMEPVSRDFFAMDTYMTVTAYGEKAAEATEAAEAEVNRLDAMLSTGNKDSEIAKVNAGAGEGGEAGEGGGTDEAGGGELSEEAGALVEKGLALYEETGRKFDIAIYPIMEAWGFTDKNYRVPKEAELEGLLPLTDASKVHYDANKHLVSFDEDGMAIDLGGIAKGYTSSRIMEIYKEHGVESGLVSLGGNVQVLGTKPDGSKWRVAVQDPGTGSADDTADGDEAAANEAAANEAAANEAAANEAAAQAQYLGVLEAADTAVITSGAYERNFTQDGVLYHHIIDPATGRPADSGLKSVTIVSSDGTLADALSTSLYIMGKDDALDYWRSHQDEFDCILMDDAGELYVTEPIADQFSSEDYHVNVVK
ncbi:MAG: FAD:protein FMN transferase [Firmicutes bacterium]|nr:FAD:protein FMN transferase [Bacillota bacterium]